MITAKSKRMISKDLSLNKLFLLVMYMVFSSFCCIKNRANMVMNIRKDAAEANQHQSTGRPVDIHNKGERSYSLEGAPW